MGKRLKRNKKITRVKKSKKPQADHLKEPVLSKALKEKFLAFLEYHPPKRFSLNLRNMLLEFMMYDGAVELLYLKDLLYDLDGLFDLLDAAQEEWHQQSLNT